MDFLKKDMIQVGLKQAQVFTASNIAYCEMLVDGRTRREILLCCYRCLVRTKRIRPIEELPQEQKKIAWQTAKDIAQNRLGRKALIEVVQALLTIEYFLNLEIN